MRSTMNVDLKNKKITVIGMGETGQGASFLANKLGASVLLSESNSTAKESFIKNAKNIGIKIENGGHTEKIYDSDLWIISPGVSDKINIVTNAKAKGIKIISEIEFASWFTDKPIIGVTGSNGKTTTVSIINEILSKSEFNPKLTGNIGYAFSRAILEDLKNCPENRIYVIELSSYQLEHIETFKPFISILLNISPDHLDRYKNMDKYLEAKMKIAMNHDSENHLLYNSDYKNITSHCKKLNTNKTTFGLLNDTQNAIKSDGSCIAIDQTKIVDIDDLTLKGHHNLSNILAAISAAKILKVSNKVIREALINFNGIEHRLEKVSIIKGVAYYNDSKATNIESVIAAIKSFNRPIILILGGQDKNTDFSTLKPFLDKKIKQVVSYGSASNKISTALRDAVALNAVFSLRDAVEECKKSAVSGDVVLLSPGCASFDQFDNFEHRGNEFKRIINEAAYA